MVVGVTTLVKDSEGDSGYSGNVSSEKADEVGVAKPEIWGGVNELETLAGVTAGDCSGCLADKYSVVSIDRRVK